MWVMTSWGVLMPGLRPPGTVEPGDPRTLQVRARRRRDLEVLRDRYMPGTLGPVINLDNTDYEYRAYCTPEAWGDALAEIGRDVDYVKFKETAETRFGDRQLHRLYVQVWGVIFRSLSTDEHRRAYWRRDDDVRAGTPATTAVTAYPRWDVGRDVDDEYGYEELADAELEAELADAKLRIDGKVVRRSGGTIDHSWCDHGAGRSARRRCQRRADRTIVRG